MKEDGSFDSEFFDDFTNKMPSEDKEALNKLKCECEKTGKIEYFLFSFDSFHFFLQFFKI